MDEKTPIKNKIKNYYNFIYIMFTFDIGFNYFTLIKHSYIQQ